MSSSSIASTAVLDHLHAWQRRAGVLLTWPTFTSDAYRDQWQAIKLLELQRSTNPRELTEGLRESEDQRRAF